VGSFVPSLITSHLGGYGKAKVLVEQEKAADVVAMSHLFRRCYNIPPRGYDHEAVDLN